MKPGRRTFVAGLLPPVRALCFGQPSPSPQPGTALLEPNRFRAWEDIRFTVTISPGRELSKGDEVLVQLPNSFSNDKVSPSFVKKWQFEDASAPHYVSILCRGGAGDFTFSRRVVGREYVGGFKVPSRHGRAVVLSVESGRMPANGQIAVTYANTRAPWLANQKPGATDHEGVVLVMVNGKPLAQLPSCEILPRGENYRRVIVPSFARPGEPFRVRLVSLDMFNNLTRETHRDVSITLNGRTLAGPITYTGRGEVAVSIDRPGVHRLVADGVESNPVVISADPKQLYWGDIHFHNYPSVDAMGNTPYEYARDVSCLDFAGATEHGAGGLAAHWSQTLKWRRENHRPGRFATILGLETNIQAPGSDQRTWHMNIYFPDGEREMIRDQRNGDSLVRPDNACAYIRENGATAQIHHSGWGYDMRTRYPDQMRLLEIYSMHGSSELYDPADPLSLSSQRRRSKDSHQGAYYARDAWALGQRFVTIGSSDNHFGQPGVRYNSIGAVYAEALISKPLLDAMNAGACYASTGERIILGFTIDGRQMGSEFLSRGNSELRFGITVHGTGELESVAVFGCSFIEGNRSAPVGAFRFAADDAGVERARNGWETVFAVRNPGGKDFTKEWVQAYDGTPKVYYLRAVQKEPIEVPAPLEGDPVLQKRKPTAWSSPIWVQP